MPQIPISNRRLSGAVSIERPTARTPPKPGPLQEATAKARQAAQRTSSRAAAAGEMFAALAATIPQGARLTAPIAQGPRVVAPRVAALAAVAPESVPVVEAPLVRRIQTLLGG